MGIGVYSVVSAVIFFNIGLLVIKHFRRNTTFLVQRSTIVLAILAALAFIRLFLPLDLEHAVVISSKAILPAIIDILELPIYKGLSIGSALLAVWAAGTVFILCKTLYVLVQEIRRIRKYTIIEDARIEQIAKACLPGEAAVVVTPNVDVPMATGIRKAYIYVPPLILSDEEIRLILLHEYQHVKNRDVCLKLVYLGLKAVFWWNPVVYIFQQEVENLLELRCDAAVTKDMLEQDRVTYLETILNVMKQLAWHHVKPLAGAASLISIKNQGFTQQRFEVVLNQKDNYNRRKTIRSICIIVIVFLCSYFVILQPTHDAPDIPGGYTEVTRDNAYITVDKNDVMELYVDGEFYETVDEEELKLPPCSDLEIIKKEEVNE